MNDPNADSWAVPPRIPAPYPPSSGRQPLGENPAEREPIPNVAGAIEAILRQPRRVMYQLRQPGSGRLISLMLVVALVCSLVYGQLTLAVFIAFAGILGNLRLLPLLRQWTNKPAVARNVLFAWLAGNLFLGSQICWVLRPFIWDPAGPVEFIGRQYFHGSFYETVFEAGRRLMFP